MWAVWRRNAAIDRYGCRARARACTLAQNRTARCSLYAALSLGTGPQADTQGAGANSDLRRPRCADHDRDPGQIHSFIVDRSVPYSCTAVSSRSHLINRGRAKTPAVNSFHGGWVAARDAALPLRGSTLGEPRPTRVGSSGGTCAAHSDARARAHARARPRCTLQHTISLHCTCSTHAHFGTCALTCTPRRGASGRGGRHWARHGRATSQERHRGPSRGPQPPQHDAARRFAAALQLVDKDAAGRRSSGRATRHASIMPR